MCSSENIPRTRLTSEGNGGCGDAGRETFIKSDDGSGKKDEYGRSIVMHLNFPCDMIKTLQGNCGDYAM